MNALKFCASVVIVAAVVSLGNVAAQLNPFGTNLFNIAQQQHQSITNQVHAQLNQAFAAVGLGANAVLSTLNPSGNPFYTPTYGNPPPTYGNPPPNMGRPPPPFPGQGMPPPPYRGQGMPPPPYSGQGMPPPPPPGPQPTTNYNGYPGQMSYGCNRQMGFNFFGGNCQPGYNNNNFVRPTQPQGFQSRPNLFLSWYPQSRPQGHPNQIPTTQVPTPSPKPTQPTNGFPNWYPPTSPSTGFPNWNIPNGFPDPNPSPTQQTNPGQTETVFQPVPPTPAPNPSTQPPTHEDIRAKPTRIHLVFPDSSLYVHRYQHPVEHDPTKQIDIRR